MMTAKLLVVILATALAAGGVGAAIADTDPGSAPALEAVDVRKDDAGPDTDLVDDDENDDPAGDRDKTRGDDGTGGGDNRGDGDRTGGDDGTGHGDNTRDGGDTAAGDSAPAPAPAPVSDDGVNYGSSDG